MDPLDHTAFLRALSPDQRRSLTRRADGPGLLRLTLHLGMIAGLGGGIAALYPHALHGTIPAIAALGPMMIGQGVCIVFLFTLLHESIHRTAFATRRLNDAAAWIAALAVALPPRWFRQFHMDHHRFTQDPARDPELSEDKPAGWAGFLLHVSGLPVWRSHAATVVRNALGRCSDVFVPPQDRAAIAGEARMMVAVYVAVATISLWSGSALAFWVWIGPALLGQPALRLYLLAEHGGCSRERDMFANTRTILTTAPVRWLAWNMPYHAEHHAFPSVPFHRLPDLHRLARPHLRVVSSGYGAFLAEWCRNLSKDGPRSP